MEKSSEPHPDPTPVRPVWVPPGVAFERLSPELRSVLTDIVGPAYRELVLAAPTAFERVAAVTYVHLAWLELCEMITVGEPPRPDAAGAAGAALRVAHYLRLVGVKDGSGKFLLALKKYQEAQGPDDPLRREGGAPTAAWDGSAGPGGDQ